MSPQPETIAILVDAFARAEPHSAVFYYLHGALLDLTGSRVPPDPDQWRSWLAGHRARLASLEWLPPTASVEATVARGIAFLLTRQRADGSFVYQPGARRQGQENVGATALALYALSKSGVPADAPATGDETPADN